MRTLRTKLILAFLLVSLAVIAILIVFARWNTSTEFRRYLLDRNQENYIATLSSYYAQGGSWSGVQQFIPRGQLPPGLPAPQVRAGEIVLVNADYEVLIGGHGFRPGQPLSSEAILDATPIEHEGAIVGYVLFPRGAVFNELPVETAFIQRLSQSLLIGSLALIGLATILGVVLARSLTRPLGKLTEATRRVAAGDLDVQVDIESRDEIGELAESFNRMNQQLAHSRDLRRQMTADIAHELRTPVSVILGYADGLKEDVIPASQETFDLIVEQAEQLEHLIEDLRTLSLAEAGELPLELEALAPLPLIERTLAGFEPQAAEKDVELVLEADRGEAQILIDPDRFRQVLANLVANALQYTPEGGRVTVGLEIGEDLVISVTDTGPGIPPQDHARIFQRFYRQDASRSRATGGSGLGLSIAKSLVDRQGGTIEVESQAGQGARFTLRFPLL